MQREHRETKVEQTYVSIINTGIHSENVVYIQIHFFSIMKNDVIPFVGKWIEPKIIILSELHQA